MKQRIQYIDRLKGIAILLVVMGHTFLFPMHPEDTSVGRIIQSFHMPLFMFLSGCVISTPPHNWLVIRDKAVRFLVPFLFFGLAFSIYIKPVVNVDSVLSSFGFLLNGSKNGYWYLWTLTVFYLTLACFNLAGRRRLLGESVIALCFFVMFYVVWTKCNKVSEMLSMEHAVCFYPFFVLGYWSNRYRLVPWLLARNWLFTVSLLAYLVLIVVDMSVLPHFVQSLLERYMTPLCAIVVCLTLFARRETADGFMERQLAYLGRNTLVVYVLHYFLVYRINLEMFAPYFADRSNTVLLWFLTFAVSIVVAYASILIGKIFRVSDFLRVWVLGEKPR